MSLTPYDAEAGLRFGGLEPPNLTVVPATALILKVWSGECLTFKSAFPSLIWKRERRADAMSAKQGYNIVRRGFARLE